MLIVVTNATRIVLNISCMHTVNKLKQMKSKVLYSETENRCKLGLRRLNQFCLLAQMISTIYADICKNNIVSVITFITISNKIVKNLRL